MQQPERRSDRPGVLEDLARTALLKGKRINVRITHCRANIATLGNASDNVSHEGWDGEVVYALPNKGMGIAFGATGNQAVLEGWLAQSKPSDI